MVKADPGTMDISVDPVITSCDLHGDLQYACSVVMVQIRGVSTAAHRRLKARAALAGKSLSEYLRGEVEELAAMPTLEEMARRLESHPPVRGMSGADAVGAGRRARERELDRR